MRLTRLCLCPCVCVMVGCAQVLAFFTARIAQENLESPSPEDILRVLAKNVDAWKSEGQARARLKASLLVRGGWASFWRPRSWDRGGLGGPRGFQEMPELRFRYEEEPNAEEFFCPFVWELAVNHPAFRFQSPAIKLFRQVGHACVWARAIGCAVCLTRNGWTVGRVLIISLLLQLPPRPAPPRRHRRRTSALPSVSTFRSLYKQKTTWSSQSTRSAGGVRGGVGGGCGGVRGHLVSLSPAPRTPAPALGAGRAVGVGTAAPLRVGAFAGGTGGASVSVQPVVSRYCASSSSCHRGRRRGGLSLRVVWGRMLRRCGFTDPGLVQLGLDALELEEAVAEPKERCGDVARIVHPCVRVPRAWSDHAGDVPRQHGARRTRRTPNVNAHPPRTMLDHSVGGPGGARSARASAEAASSTASISGSGSPSSYTYTTCRARTPPRQRASHGRALVPRAPAPVPYRSVCEAHCAHRRVVVVVVAAAVAAAASPVVVVVARRTDFHACADHLLASVLPCGRHARSPSSSLVLFPLKTLKTLLRGSPPPFPPPAFPPPRRPPPTSP